MPHLEKLSKEYGDRGLVVLLLSDQAREDIQKYLTKHPLGTMNGYFPEGAKETSFLKDARGRPLTFVLDRNGVMREFIVGESKYERLAKLVGKYL